MSMRSASASDIPLIIDIISDAFAEDPVVRWIFGNDRALRAGLVPLLDALYLPQGFTHISADEAATAIWLNPGAVDPSPWALLRYAARVLPHSGLKPVRRGTAFGRASHPYHPKEPHFYLFMIGVRRSGQGKGLGGSLMRAGLDIVDQAGAAAYLEATTPNSAPLYQRHGFAPMGTLDLPEDGPPVLAMTRAQVAQR